MSEKPKSNPDVVDRFAGLNAEQVALVMSKPADKQNLYIEKMRQKNAEEAEVSPVSTVERTQDQTAVELTKPMLLKTADQLEAQNDQPATPANLAKRDELLMQAKALVGVSGLPDDAKKEKLAELKENDDGHKKDSVTDSRLPNQIITTTELRTNPDDPHAVLEDQVLLSFTRLDLPKDVLDRFDLLAIKIGPVALAHGLKTSLQTAAVHEDKSYSPKLGDTAERQAVGNFKLFEKLLPRMVEYEKLRQKTEPSFKLEVALSNPTSTEELIASIYNQKPDNQTQLAKNEQPQNDNPATDILHAGVKEFQGETAKLAGGVVSDKLNTPTPPPNPIVAEKPKPKDQPKDGDGPVSV